MPLLGAQYRIWRVWYNGSYTMIAKPIRALDLHYPMIQFLIIHNNNNNNNNNDDDDDDDNNDILYAVSNM